MSIEERLNQFPLVPGFVCPAEFWPALGYADDARYIAIYWEQCGDEAAWADGRETFVGAFWSAYLDLLAHNWPLGAPVDLGSSETAATHWLVIDRATEKAWLVPAEEAQDALRLQWPVADVAADGVGVLGSEALMARLEYLVLARPRPWSGARYRAFLAALCERDRERGRG